MKKRFIITYTIFASAFILFVLSFFGINLYKEYKEGDSRAASVFANTVYNLYSDLDNTKNKNKSVYSRIEDAAGTLQNYSFYEIEKNGNLIFSYPGNTPQNQTSSKLTKNFSTIIEVNEENYLVTCNIYLLRPYSIAHYAKISFIMILGITLLTVILIIASGNKSKVEENTKDNDILDDIDDEPDTNSLNDLDDLDNENYTDQDDEESNKDELVSIEGTIDDIEQNVDELEDLHTNSEEDFSFEDAINALEPIDELQEDTSSSEPEGLFSSTTGFGWESYLITRLNNEINRAIASELDISLFIIKITGLDRKDPLTKTICDYIATQFQFRDLLFEYKEDCVVAIKTGENLDEAINFADNLYEEITKLLDNTSYKCYIGITTRSVRMISAEHFIHEAEQALVHAEEDNDNPIIAFKADIDKYRKYVEQKFDN